jgi:hypothetical protein
MPGLPASSLSSDSDYFPSDGEDEEWIGDFEEDLSDDSPSPPDQSNSLSQPISSKNQQRGDTCEILSPLLNCFRLSH